MLLIMNIPLFLYLRPTIYNEAGIPAELIVSRGRCEDFHRSGFFKINLKRDFFS